MAYDLSSSQAAEVLGVHDDTLRRWADDGVLPYIRTPGNHRRFDRADLEAYIAGQVVPATEPEAS